MALTGELWTYGRTVPPARKRNPLGATLTLSRRRQLKGATAAVGAALLGAWRVARAGAQAGPIEVAQDLADGTAQNWLVYPDGLRVPFGCRYEIATGDCVGAGAT